MFYENDFKLVLMLEWFYFRVFKQLLDLLGDLGFCTQCAVLYSLWSSPPPGTPTLWGNPSWQEKAWLGYLGSKSEEKWTVCVCDNCRWADTPDPLFFFPFLLPPYTLQPPINFPNLTLSPVHNLTLLILLQVAISKEVWQKWLVQYILYTLTSGRTW